MGRSSKRPRRTFTPKESDAWSHRPFLFKGTLEAAVALHATDAATEGLLVAYATGRDATDATDATDAQWRRNRKLAEDRRRLRAERAMVPEECYRHEHPLRTGRRDKLYRKYDFVTLICDALTRLVEGHAADDAFGLFDPSPKRRRVGDAAEDAAEAADEARRKEKEARRVVGGNFGTYSGWKCPCCANTDVRLQVQLKEALVCKCGFVVRLGGEMVATHREKLGAEECDDKTQHADRVRERTHDKYDRPAQSADERRREWRYAGKVSSIGGRIKGLGRVCDAQRLAEQTAAKEALQVEVEAGRALTRTEGGKGIKVVEHCDAMFKALAPVDRIVARTVRKEADRVWTMAALHSRKCTRVDCCELRIVERHPSIIGGAVFDLALERLIHGELDFEGSTRQHFIDLQTRMQRSPAFNNTSCLTQMATTKAMVNVMQSAGFDADRACSPAPPPAPPAAAAAAAAAGATALARSPKPQHALAKVPFGRNDSSVSCGEGSPPPGEVVQLRDAVSTVFLAHRSELPVSVRDGTHRALQAPGFVDGLKAIEGLKATEGLKPHSMQCLAFCALNAVWREQQADERVSFAKVGHCALNVGIAASLALDLAVAEEGIARIRTLVPADATSEASTGADDDLFS